MRTSYSWAAEIDRLHKLNLTSSRFDTLVLVLEQAADFKVRASELLRLGREVTLKAIAAFVPKEIA